MDKDKYIEHIVKKQASLLAVMAKYFAYFITAFGVYALFSSTLIGTIILMLGAGLIYVTGMAVDVEYEFLFVNDDCEISKIYKKSTRKKCASFEGSKVDRIACCTSDKFKNDLQIKRDWTVTKYVSGNADKEDMCYGFVYTENEKQKVAILELNDKVIDYINRVYKNKMESYSAWKH